MSRGFKKIARFIKVGNFIELSDVVENMLSN